MNRIISIVTLLSVACGITVQATDLAAIVEKVSANSDKIQSFSADAQIRYKI